MANREKPISDRFSSVLRISYGNLVLFNESQTPIWSTNVNPTISGTVQAVLLSKGNLVLNEGSNLSTPLWQSFDYPSHIFLPGSKLGIFNKKTKTNAVLLTSWKNFEDPAPGYYSLEQFSIGKDSYMVLLNRSSSEIYWSSGYWNGKIFSLVPEMRLNYIYNYSFVSNENESYFTYDLYNSSILSLFSIDVSGQIKQQNWAANQWVLFWRSPREECDVYRFCGAYGSCNRSHLPSCSCLTGFEPKSPSDWSS